MASLLYSGHGLVLDVAHFIAQQRSERQRNFLRLFRHSQMFHMWAVDRLQLAAACYDTPDAFERKVCSTRAPVYVDHLFGIHVPCM